MPQETALLVLDREVSVARRVEATPRSTRRDGGLTDSFWGRHFVEMEAAYRLYGGIASDSEVIDMLRQCSDQPMSRLARWIVARDVVSFDCQGTTWLPLFQFEGELLSVRPAVTSAIQELADVFDDWELATWFALPNTWLQGTTPVEAITICPFAVREAARADRFIARG